MAREGEYRSIPLTTGVHVSGLRVNISKLSEGTHHHSLSTEPADIGLDKRFTRPVQVNAVLEKSNRQLLVKADSQTRGSFVCDRCLEEFERNVESHYSILYVQGQAVPSDAEETEEEVQYLPVDANMIDLGEDVRQYLLLSLPLKTLCREDCAGLCPICGTNKNKVKCSCTVAQTDPRWADLKRLLDN